MNDGHSHSTPHTFDSIDDKQLVVWTLAVLVVWNLAGNLVLPGAWYIPANLVVAAAIIVAARRAGFSWDDLGLGAGNVPSGLRLGLQAGLVVGAVLALALLIPQAAPFLEDDAVAAGSTFDHWFRPLVRIPLGTVVMEEVLFRGVLLAILMRRYSVRTAVVVSSLAFGTWHIVPALTTSTGSAVAVVGTVIGTVVVTTLAGVVFALLRLRSKSLLAPMLAHWGTNSLAYAAALIALRTAS